METGGMYVTWVETNGERIEATLLDERPRHRILRLSDGNIAKTVIGSRRVRDEGGEAPEMLTRWTERIRMVRDTLPTFTHKGILRARGDCVDGFGDEGYICETLEMHKYRGNMHPCTTTVRTFLHACYRLASAAGYLHQHKLVHSDITPHNVGFRNGRPVLLDFEMLTIAGRTSPWDGYDDDNRRWLCCTPSCASPEQVHGYELFPYSDVYCLGLTMLSWISGYVGMHMTDDPDKERALGRCANGSYPYWGIVERRLRVTDVVDLFVTATRRCPFDRYRNGDEFAAAILQLIRNLPSSVLSRPILAEPPLPTRVSIVPSISTVQIQR